MLTKYYLEIDGNKIEVPSECLKNWDQICCAYKRTEYSGVTRSFTSQFEFVDEMYDILMRLYLRDGFNAVAILYLYAITDRWEWEEQYSAPIDFSTIIWNNHTAKVSCVDDSLASFIKSRKSTKYEFIVGQDIPIHDKLLYDRIVMSNSVVHEVMGNGDASKYTDGSVAMIKTSDIRRLPTYVIGDAETYENSPVQYDDQTEDDGSFFIKIVKPAPNLSLDLEINYYGGKQPFTSVATDAEIYLMRFDSANPKINSNYTNLGTVFSIKETEWLETSRTCVGCFASLSALKKAYPNPPQNVYAIIGKSAKPQECEAVYFTPETLNVDVEWLEGVRTITGGRSNPRVICVEHRFLSHFDLSSQPAGSMFALVYKCNMQKGDSLPTNEFHVRIKSKMQTSWKSRATSIYIDALSPKAVLSALMDKICDGRINIHPHIDDADERVAKTFLFAAESIRDIPGAKLYTTFQEFIDWMETVFGYTYYIGEPTKSVFKGPNTFNGDWNLGDGELLNEVCPASNASDLMFIIEQGVFAVFNTDNGKFYTKWSANESYPASDEYNDDANKARRDKVFVEAYSGKAYCIDDSFALQDYDGDPDRCALDNQDVFFVHRSSLFKGDDTLEFRGVRNFQYSIIKDLVVSNVVIGYDKQDYEAECGRDEWNFSSQYTTGVDLFEKKLELKSKYRADCYGFEFLAQERTKDNTDNKSDNTVFFVHCGISTTTEGEGDDAVETSNLVIDRSTTIVGALSDTVFNGEYTPYKCIKANEGYLSAVKKAMTLQFASSDGNTDVIVDGIAGNSDIQLDAQLFTAGVIEFTTGDVDTPIDANALYKISVDGVTYTGYFMEATFRYSKEEAVKYQLIVKSIEYDS